MAKTDMGKTVEILAGRLEQARRLEAKQAGHVAAIEGRKVTQREEEGALVKRMRQGADVSRELAKVREAARDLEDEFQQAVRIHGDLKADVADLEAQHGDAEKAVRKETLDVRGVKVGEKGAALEKYAAEAYRDIEERQRALAAERDEVRAGFQEFEIKWDGPKTVDRVGASVASARRILEGRAA